PVLDLDVADRSSRGAAAPAAALRDLGLFVSPAGASAEAEANPGHRDDRDASARHRLAEDGPHRGPASQLLTPTPEALAAGPGHAHSRLLLTLGGDLWTGHQPVLPQPDSPPRYAGNPAAQQPHPAMAGQQCRRQTTASPVRSPRLPPVKPRPCTQGSV